MRTVITIVFLTLFLAVFAASCSKGLGSSPEATVVAYLEAQKAKDSAGMLKCYQLGDQQRVKERSKENMEESLGDLESYDANINETVSGDDAVCTVLARFKKDEGKPTRFKLYFVLKRGADGWRIGQLETALKRMSATDMVVDK